MKILKSIELEKALKIKESTIIHGNALEVLKLIPDNTIQCVVTSPPYWGLRDYGIPNQIGAENNLDDYINNLASIFREVRRVLKKDGTLWLNIGDSYTSGNRKYRAPDKKTDTKTNVRAMNYRPDTPEGLKPKDLIGVPWRVAFALQVDGWFLRSDIIWNKPNCMPESVKDRPTKSHEYIFLLSKSKHYYYDYQSIKEPSETGELRNKRTVWNVNTQGFKDAHFATFPPELIVPCIKAGSKVNDFVLDPFFGSGTVGVVCNELSRRYIGIEISQEYIEMATQRIINTEYAEEEGRKCNEL
ncbi:DNA methylase N-4/N-6 domain protein [Desulforamulus reducens MI-1]|uniref:Methyltransferase n=1 Tax=Desulforamulus reducens (strain ATCC BAA-1160 / DSM 100696 / MI-1) TaxID=349161 RepID=A4J2U9_DESRM|nr:site-specific DNA-methyltransferase [Desulforamulus reducens]ABO49402.1 DNA methylase N-4/N-6 domain protein [Desulforamulus reducens MI-1]